jgi:hypothetical protein
LAINSHERRQNKNKGVGVLGNSISLISTAVERGGDLQSAESSTNTSECDADDHNSKVTTLKEEAREEI